jgi:hypothetical protein
LDEADIPLESTEVFPQNPDVGDADLECLAERNAAATRELISGAGNSRRSEKAIAADLAETIVRLRAVATSFFPGHRTIGAMSSCPEPSPKS